MLNFRSGRPASILGLIFVMGIVTGVVVGQRHGLHLPDPARWALFLVLFALASWLTLIYWRRLDEAAREAQKAAWYWGGSLGMGAGFVAVAAFSRIDLTFAGLLPADASPVAYLHTGAIVVIAFQLMGFLLAWAFWWWSKR